MIKKCIVLLMSFLSLWLTSGCFTQGGDVKFSSEVDLAKTEIVVLGQGVANGSSFLYVEVRVINSNDSPVLNFLPELSVSDAAIRSCGRTNKDGVARCAITSTVAGVKNLSLLNIDFTVEAQATFLPPMLSSSIMSNVPGSSITNTSGGHQISASLSNLSAPLKYEHPSGHIVYSTVQGIVLSDE